jgi:hypothetical protein
MNSIRDALGSIDPGSTAHKAQDEPGIQSIYPVLGHDSALTFERPLVVGNRGMGKSFWAAVLSHNETRRRAAELYPRARLTQLHVRLGSHEAAGKQMNDVAPSQKELSVLLDRGVSAELIWQGVLLRALHGVCNVPAYSDLESAIESINNDPLGFERILRESDFALQQRGERFLILFDALDRLAREWSVIRDLSRELLRMALELSGYRAIRAKIFMRSDQFGDGRLFDFQDASKLKTGVVKLEWNRADLYGLLFTRIWRDEQAHSEFERIVNRVQRVGSNLNDLPDFLRADERKQAEVFSLIAGEFMGTDRRRGRAYSWLHQHLADAFGQTSPRSFLVAVGKAATRRGSVSNTAIDYFGIKEGVIEASRGRVDELKEDNIWIGEALEPFPLTPVHIRRP